MRYDNLQQLISQSRSSRKYFLSLPVSMQMSLYECNDYIHSAAQLHEYVRGVENYEHAVDISRQWL